MQIVKARVLHDYGWIVRFWLGIIYLTPLAV